MIARFPPIFQGILLYVAASLACCFSTILFIELGSQYGSDRVLPEIYRFLLILLFVLYSSLISPILLDWVLKDSAVHPVRKCLFPALSLGIVLLLINAVPPYFVLILLSISWLLSLILLSRAFLFRSENALKFGWLCNRLLLAGIILTILSIPYHWWVRDGFPGQFTSIQSRHEWAEETFEWSYLDAIRVIHNCPIIVETLGEIEEIGPTEGRNYSGGVLLGSEGQYGFTLEIVGSEDRGVVEVSKGLSYAAKISPPLLTVRNSLYSEVVSLDCK